MYTFAVAPVWRSRMQSQIVPKCASIRMHRKDTFFLKRIKTEKNLERKIEIGPISIG